ncbi:DNA repair protein [Helicobacter ailurogastricus]|uniref:DNA repair protein n=1 Tax=Helicobacter ailurogastricus TaxID=1578720 RepID=UPI0022BF7681|nr:DNA repair protein [Helicobacter ailurogastricus]GLH57735.1 DNA repair protein RecN [Helicobacter ailurogastricus]GLH58856.1 DNA repair protein RecN [Helicobacter ailurogastricus]
MIESLEIQGGLVFALAKLDFSPRLNVISGASGSGKSVLVGAILASVGLKPLQAKFVKAQWKQGKIQATKDKRTSYTLNAKPMTKKSLQESFSPLVLHISSYKQAQELQPHFLLSLLDGYGPPKLLESFKEVFASYQKAQEQHQILQEQGAHLDLQAEMARFELSKLQALDLSEGAYEKLLERKRAHQMQEKRGVEVKAALEALEHADKIVKALPELKALALKQLLDEAQDFLLDTEHALEELEALDIEALLDEISQLGGVVKKYGSVALARERLEQLKANCKEYNQHQESLQASQENCAKLEQESLRLALQLKATRQANLAKMQQDLESYTNKLLLKPPILELQATPLSSSGLESLELQLGNTPSTHISAGEHNRLRLSLLALKAHKRGKEGQTIFVDELDTNLSGQESACVAQILKELSAHYQIIAISHAPHLPALAQRHFLVYTHNKQTCVKLLNKKEQTLEIARMVDANLGKEAIAYAKMKLKPQS